MVVMKTDRLIIRNEIESDLSDIHRLWSDKETMYYLDDIWSNTIEDTAGNLKMGIANSDGHYFCICDKTTGNYMGNICSAGGRIRDYVSFTTQ
jgi:RimJ/RimL family protein N-acetyltransferase